jgi:hypothetical protein
VLLAYDGRVATDDGSERGGGVVSAVGTWLVIAVVADVFLVLSLWVGWMWHQDQVEWQREMANREGRVQGEEEWSNLVTVIEVDRQLTTEEAAGLLRTWTEATATGKPIVVPPGFKLRYERVPKVGA